MLKNRVYRACASDVQTSPPHQVKFLFSRLHELVPTNNDLSGEKC